MNSHLAFFMRFFVLPLLQGLKTKSVANKKSSLAEPRVGGQYSRVN